MQTQEAETFIISQKQAHAFAVAVFADIRAYREIHQNEFEKFLKSEQEKGESGNGNDLRNAPGRMRECHIKT